MKQGTKIKTAYGTTETVLSVNGCQVVTYESITKQTWYHISKVFKIK